MVKLYKSVRRCNFQRNKNLNPVLFPTKGLHPKRRIFLYRFRREPVPFAYHCIECTSYTGNLVHSQKRHRLAASCGFYRLATSCQQVASSLLTSLFKLKQVCENQTCCNLRGSLHESGLSYNPDRSHSVSVVIIGD